MRRIGAVGSQAGEYVDAEGAKFDVAVQFGGESRDNALPEHFRRHRDNGEEGRAKKDEQAEERDEGPEPRLLDHRRGRVDITSVGPASFHALNAEHGACQLELKRRDCQTSDRPPR
jgi:hypothetical protein